MSLFTSYHIWRGLKSKKIVKNSLENSCQVTNWDWDSYQENLRGCFQFKYEIFRHLSTFELWRKYVQKGFDFASRQKKPIWSKILRFWGNFLGFSSSMLRENDKALLFTLSTLSASLSRSWEMLRSQNLLKGLLFFAEKRLFKVAQPFIALTALKKSKSGKMAKNSRLKSLSTNSKWLRIWIVKPARNAD